MRGVGRVCVGLASYAMAWTCLCAVADESPDEPPRHIDGSLFIESQAATALAQAGLVPSSVAIEQRLVQLNPIVLDNLFRDGAAEFTLDLPGMGEVIIDVDRRWTHADGERAIHGRVRGDAHSYVLLETFNGELVGDIYREPHDMVQIRRPRPGTFAMLGEAADGLHVVQSVQEQLGAMCGNELEEPPVHLGHHEPDPNHAAKGIVVHDDNAAPGARHGHDDDDNSNDAEQAIYVDVMIVFTDGARDAAGGTGAARLLGLLTVDTANQLYADSGTDVRMRMARMYTETYSETGGTHSNHLDRIRTDDDGIMDDVHWYRDTVGADIVCLMIDDLDPTDCLVGTCITYGLACRPYAESSSNDSCAFQTCHWENMALPTWSMPHEAGHNYGAYHDRNQTPSDPDEYIALYGRGHFWDDSSGNRQRTVMGRNALGGTRRPYFSNPDVDYNGDPTGDPSGTDQADAARLFDEVTDTVAGYRSAAGSTMYVDTDWTGSETGSEANPYNTLWEGYIHVRWGGFVYMKSCEDESMYSLTRKMTIKSVGGSSVIRRAP